MAFKPKQVGVTMDAHSFQPGDPSFQCSFAFLVCVLRDPVASFNLCSIYIIHEAISCGRAEIEKFVGICYMDMRQRKRVGLTGFKICQHDMVLAMVLCFPHWCCEKRAIWDMVMISGGCTLCGLVFLQGLNWIGVCILPLTSCCCSREYTRVVGCGLLVYTLML